MVHYVLCKTNTAISSYLSAVQPLFIKVSSWSSLRHPRALLSRVGEELSLPVPAVMLAVSLQRDVVLQSSWAVAVCGEREGIGIHILGDGLS